MCIHLPNAPQVNRFRESNKDRTLFLDGGDYSLGTMWYYLFKANIVADALELLKHDAVVTVALCLGTIPRYYHLYALHILFNPFFIFDGCLWVGAG